MESRYNQEVLIQSRYIINQFNATIGEDYESESDGSLPSEYYREDDEVYATDDGFIDYTLELKFNPTDDYDLDGSPYIIEAEADNDTVMIQIIYNPDTIKSNMTLLVAEIKDAMRHELEHVAQYNLFGKETLESEPDDYPFYKYLMLRHEIPAFVRGLYATAKTKKIPMTQAIEDFFVSYKKRFKSPKEIDVVRKTWTSYAKKHIPNFR